jgi:hypothetical protein
VEWSPLPTSKVSSISMANIKILALAWCKSKPESKNNPFPSKLHSSKFPVNVHFFGIMELTSFKLMWARGKILV